MARTGAQTAPETLAVWLLRAADRALLDEPLRGLVRDEPEGDLRDLLEALDGAGDADSLGDACRNGSLERFLDERCNARESDAIVRRLREIVGRGAGAVDDPTRLVTPAALPDDPSAILAWAKQHRVAHELSRPASEVLSGRGADGETSLLEACFADRDARDTSGRPLERQALANEARTYLVAEATRALASSARTELWSRPVSASWVLLAERLRAFVGDSDPDTLATLRFAPTRRASLDPVSGSFEASLRGADDVPVAASVFLAGYEARGLEGRCGRCSRPRCLHVRVVAARALDVCHDPTDRLRPAFESFVAAPSWKGFVDSLVVEPVATGRLDFVVRSSDLGTTIAPRVRGSGKRAQAKVVPARQLLRDGTLGDQDRAVLETLAASSRTFGTAFVAADAQVLRALVGHPSVRDDATDEPIRVTEQSIHVEFVEVPGGVSPRTSLGGVPIVHRDGDRATLAITRDRGGRALTFGAIPPAVRRLLAALSSYRSILPEESFSALAPFVASLREVARVSAPSAFDGLERPPPERLTLRLVPRPDDGIDASLVVRAFPLSPPYPPGMGPSLVHGLEHGVRVVTRRNLVDERELATRATEALGTDDLLEVGAYAYRVDSGPAVLELIARASRSAELLDIEWAEGSRRYSVSGSLSSADVSLTITRKGRYLALDGRAKLGKEDIPLARLFDAARRGERFVRIAGDDHVEIERELLDRLEAAGLAVHEHDRELAMALAAAPSVARIFAGMAIEGDEATQDLLARATAAVDVGVDADPLPTLTTELRDYQREGVRFLLALARWAPGACLADEMGLGKTVQSVAVLAARRELGPQLVVGPTSMVSSWVESIERFAPTLAPIAYRGSNREGRLADIGAGAVLVTSYDVLLRDAEPLSAIRFCTLVVDEAQLVKNARTARAHAVASVDADFRIALTGTPIENRLGDLYGIFHVVAPDLLGSAARFRARFAVPIERYDDAERANVLRSLVRPFFLRRTKDEVALELPSRSESVLLVELSPAERELYDAAERHARAMLDRHHREQVGRSLELLAELTRLRQLACHPRLAIDDSRIESSKLRAFLDLLDDLTRRGHRALVFSQFTSHLALVREALVARSVSFLELDGSTPGAARGDLVARFQGGEGAVFLISLKAGGTGLDLTGADYVIHLDPWWNPAAEDQASDRAHRIGQTKPVTIVRLVSRGTIEEKVLELHAQKRRLAASVLEGDPGAGALDLDQIRALFATDPT